MENQSLSADLKNSQRGELALTTLNSKPSLLKRLMRSPKARERFVESHLSKGIAFQIRALRDREGWSQQKLAEKNGSNQNAIYRAENPNYGKQTLSTLRKIAAAFDVALVVRFVSFSELLDWATTTPRVVNGLSPASLAPASFDMEEVEDAFEKTLNVIEIKEATNSSSIQTSLPEITPLVLRSNNPLETSLFGTTDRGNGIFFGESATTDNRICVH